MKALVHHESEFDRISVEDAYIFGFHDVPKFDLKGIEIADVNCPFLYPGDRMTGIGGKNTSAGFKTISLTDCVMEYCGIAMFQDERFNCLCFKLIKNGHVVDADFKNSYQASYYGWLRVSKDHWFVSNSAGAGRMIETQAIRLCR